MNPHLMTALAVVPLLSVCAADPVIWMDQPARTFHESLLVGNGRLGAMDFGGVERQRIVLNESTMWSGGPYPAQNPDAHRILPEIRRLLFAGEITAAESLLGRHFSYPAGVKGWFDEQQFGCYQILSDLWIDYGPARPLPVIHSPSGHARGDGKTIEGSSDGDPSTKWCVQHAQPAVIWQVDLSTPTRVPAYHLTSADDVPARDPQDWTLEGSADATNWIVLDRRQSGGPFAKRFETRTFHIEQPGTYRHYRFTFRPPDPYFQIAEIAFEGVSLSGPAASPGTYRRSLDLRTGIARTEVEVDGIRFTRELLASKPDEVLALRIRSSKSGALHFRARLDRREYAAVRVAGDDYELAGQLPFHRPGGGGEGIRYRALLRVIPQGGRAEVTDSGWRVTGADEAIVLISAGTSLRDPEYASRVQSRIDRAAARDADDLARDAIADHQRYMDRVALSLPSGPHAGRPTPERVRRNEAEPDPSLAALYFQFGRYLMIAGSRPDSPLPLNLQGLWAEEYSTPWRGDFHSNINLQMNYWPALSAQLADCHLPLLRFLEGVAEDGAKTARAYFDAPGWTAYHTQNPWFETVPSYLPATAGPTCGAWLALHIWEHYRFTHDEDLLRRFYPVLRGAAEFCAAVLVPDPRSGHLVTVPSSSPENHYLAKGADGKERRSWICAGSTYDIQIIRGLFEGTAAAARVLKTDEDFAARLDALRAQLPPTRLNEAGRIMEWQEDFGEVEVNHRHVSHLWGLHPGTEISPATPALLEGARRSLERRGDASTGWSMAWKANFWARLQDGNRADRLLSMLIGRGAGNLLCLHPPFQIDGNFGGASAVAEMLLQSHEIGTDGQPVLHLLPALPAAWSSGEVRGLAARGDLTVDLRWENGVPVQVRIHGRQAGVVKVRSGGVLREEKVAARASGG